MDEKGKQNVKRGHLMRNGDVSRGVEFFPNKRRRARSFVIMWLGCSRSAPFNIHDTVSFCCLHNDDP